MAVVVITAPEPLVDLATAKKHLQVEHSGDDALISAYIDAASAHIDGPAGWLNRAVGEQVLELRGRWCDGGNAYSIDLPHGPIGAVTSVLYDDEDGDEQTFDDASYRLTARGAVELVDGAYWPSLRWGSDAVRIRYSAGYEVIPPPIVAAVLLMVGDLYGNRETVSEPGKSAIPKSTTVEALLSPYRVWSA